MNTRHGGATPRRWLAFLYTAAVAGYPLVAEVPVALDLDSRAVSFPYRAVIVVVSLVVVLGSARRKELYAGALWMPLTLFWILYLARILVDTLLNPVALGIPPVEYFLYAFGMCFIPMLALFARPSDATLRLALRLTILTATVAVVAGIGLGFRALLAGQLRGIETGRFELWTLDPISVGHLGASLTTLAAFKLRARDRGPRGSSIGLLVAGAVGLVAVGVAASKGPLLALVISLSFLLLMDWREGHRLRPLAVALALPLLAVPGALYLEALGFGLVSRIQVGLDDPIRLQLLTGARDQFLAHPLVGSSLDERVSLTYPHNTFVESFMAVGILGGLCYSVFHLLALRRAFRVILRRPAAAWVGILCVQYTVGALFSGSLYTSNTMWALLAASVAAADVPAPAPEDARLAPVSRPPEVTMSRRP